MKEYLARLQAYIERRESRRTFKRDGCTYTEVTYHEGLLGEVKVDERFIRELQHVGGFDTIGPIWILSGKALLHLERDIASLTHRCWPLNPLTAILYPFWWAWRTLERKAIWLLVVRARKVGVIVLPEATTHIKGNRYVYLLGHLWFTKRAHAARVWNCVAEERRKSIQRQNALIDELITEIGRR